MKRIVLLICFSFLFTACEKEMVNRIFENRALLLKEFDHVSLFYGRGEESRIMLLDYQQKQNFYWIYRSKGSFRIIGMRNEIDNALVPFLKKISNRNTLQIKSAILKKFTECQSRMQSLEINSIDSRDKERGIALHLHLEGGGDVFYMPDKNKVMNITYRELVEKSRRIGPSWYYSEKR